MNSKVIILFIAFLLLKIQYANTQSVVDNFRIFDIRYSSCEIINSINKELMIPKYNKEFQMLRDNEQANNQLRSDQDVKAYIDEFNIILGNTKKRYESQEFLWKTKKEIGKYGLSVLGNYAQALPTKHLTNFLTPAIQQGFELYVDGEIEKSVNLHKEDIDKIIKDRINLLYTNGIDVRTANDEIAFTNMFALAHGEIPALNREEYAMFNKELIKRAYDFTSKNRDQIRLLNLKLTSEYEAVKQEVNSKIDDFQKNITNDVNNRFKDIGNSLQELAKNQEEIFNTLEDIKNRVKTNEIKIASLENEMIKLENNVTELKKIQDEHSKLIAQNLFQIDILSGYTFQNLNTSQKLSALNKGHFDNIFSPNEKSKLIDELNRIKNKETIISVSNDIENYSSALYGGLINIGAIKGPAAQNLGKFISAITVTTGIAKVYAGDFSGLTNIVSGLTGLFGKPQPSPELQMLTKIYEGMNERFDIVDQRLKLIDVKLDTLTSITINMYKNMAVSFQYTQGQLERINWKIDNLNVKATALLYKDYQACKTLKNILEKNNVSFNVYSDYRTYYNQECKQCLQGITDFTVGKNYSYFYVSTNEALKNENVVKNEITEIYDPTMNLFKIFYDENINYATYALMFPFSSTNDTNKPLYHLSKIDSLKGLDINIVLDNYYSYEMVNEFTNLLLKFGDYFLIKGGNENFKPSALKKYLKTNDINKINRDLLEERLIKLLDIVQFSIAQQSLISGNQMIQPIYATLFNSSNDEEAKDLAIKAIINNKLLAINFATHLINKNLDISDTLKIKRLFENAPASKASLDSLNSLIYLNDIKFQVATNSNKLQVTFSKKGQSINILCPNFSTILENKMLNSEAIYSLLDSRQRINSKLIDLTFTKSMNSANSISHKFKYYYSLTK